MTSRTKPANLIYDVDESPGIGALVMLSRMINARKTFVMGTSIVFGLSVDFIPGKNS
jgi:hypothetical protein